MQYVLQTGCSVVLVQFSYDCVWMNKNPNLQALYHLLEQFVNALISFL